MYELTSNELKKEGLIENYYYSCFLKWKNTVAKYKLGKLNCQDSVELLMDITNKEQLMLQHDLLDLRILNSIATIYAESGHSEESIIFYEQILNMNIKAEQFPIFITKVINNYSKCLYILGRYSDSVTIIKKGIKICKKYHHIEMLGYLYLRLAKSQEKLSDQYSMKEVACTYYSALFFLNILDLKQYVREIKEEKRYLLELLTLEDLLDFNL